MESEILPQWMAESHIFRKQTRLNEVTQYPFATKKYGCIFITCRGYLKRIKKTSYRVWSVYSLLVKALWLLIVCVMQVLATRSVWSTFTWACITTPSSAGLSTTCSHLSVQSCRGWPATTRGTRVTARPSSASALTLPPVLPKSSSSEYCWTLPEPSLNMSWVECKTLEVMFYA